MPVIQPPPYQDAGDTQRWHEWYRLINEKLTNLSISIDGIDDVVITAATDDELLVYDTGVWVNKTLDEYHPILQDLATLGAVTADSEFIVGTGAGAFAYESGDTARQSLGLSANAGATTTDVTSASYTHLAADRYILCDTSSNAITVNLLAAATAGDGYRVDIKMIDDTNTVTIDANASETIDGDLTIDLVSLYDNLPLVCDGSNWFIL